MAIAEVNSAGGSNSGGVTSIAVTKPSGAAQNQTIIVALQVNSFGSDPGTITAPDGTWSQDDQSLFDGSGNRSAVFHKILGSSEPSSYTFSWSASSNVNWASAVYSGASATAPIDAELGQNTTLPSLVAPSVSPVGGSDMLVCIWATGAGQTISAPAGMNQRQAVESAFIGCLTLADQLLSSSGATGTRTATTPSGTSAARGISITLTAGGGGGGSAALPYSPRNQTLRRR